MLTGACGQTESSRTARSPSPSKTPLTLEVTLATTSGEFAVNHDDTYCMWREPSWTLRDGEDTIIGTGKPKGEAEAEIGGRRAAVGRVISPAPDYRCELQFTVEAELRDFYKLEVAVTTIGFSTAAGRE